LFLQLKLLQYANIAENFNNNPVYEENFNKPGGLFGVFPEYHTIRLLFCLFYSERRNFVKISNV